MRFLKRGTSSAALCVFGHRHVGKIGCGLRHANYTATLRGKSLLRMRPLLVLSAFLLSIAGRAQQGFFANAAYAWMWAAPSAVDIRFNSPADLIAPPIIWVDDFSEMSGGSFAAGQSAWMEVGYRLSERLGFSLGGRYVFAPRTWRRQYEEGFYLFDATTTLSRRAEAPIFLEPGVKLFIPLGKRTEAHIRLGVLVPLRHSIRAESITEDIFDDVLWQSSSRLRTRFSVGGFGGVGLTAKLSDGFGLFVQGDFGLLSLRTRDEIVERLFGPDYEDLMPRIGEAQRVINYVNYGRYSVSGPLDEPSYRSSYLVPFNFWSIEAGVRWALE